MSLSFLKPNKRNVIGTVLILATNWIGSFISTFAMQLVVPRNMPSGGREAFGSAGGMQALGGLQMGGNGLLTSVASQIILALLFYVVISFIIGKAAAEPQLKDKEAKIPEKTPAAKNRKYEC